MRSLRWRFSVATPVVSTLIPAAAAGAGLAVTTTAPAAVGSLDQAIGSLDMGEIFSGG